MRSFLIPIRCYRPGNHDLASLKRPDPQLVVAGPTAGWPRCAAMPEPIRDKRPSMNMLPDPYPTVRKSWTDRAREDSNSPPRLETRTDLPTSVTKHEFGAAFKFDPKPKRSGRYLRSVLSPREPVVCYSHRLGQQSPPPSHRSAGGAGSSSHTESTPSWRCPKNAVPMAQMQSTTTDRGSSSYATTQNALRPAKTPAAANRPQPSAAAAPGSSDALARTLFAQAPAPSATEIGRRARPEVSIAEEDESDSQPLLGAGGGNVSSSSNGNGGGGGGGSSDVDSGGNLFSWLWGGMSTSMPPAAAPDASQGHGSRGAGGATRIATVLPSRPRPMLPMAGTASAIAAKPARRHRSTQLASGPQRLRRSR